MYVRSLTASLILTLSFAGHANPEVNAAERSVRTWRHSSAEIWDSPLGYQLHIKSHDLALDENKRVNREIIVPVSVKVEANGRASSYQVGGRGDLDIATGFFKDFRGHRVADFFTSYQGTFRNIGLVVAGMGRTRASSSQGIKFEDSNGTMLGPHPDSAGFNGGLTWQDFELTITPRGNVARIFTFLYSGCAPRNSQQCVVKTAQRSVSTTAVMTELLD